MEVKDTIIIAKDFSDKPGARYRRDGENSGEEFLDRLLRPKFESAVNGKYILSINLDNVWGYPSSFVSGSFGKLSLEKGSELVIKHIQFISDQNKLRLEKIINEIMNPKSK